MNVRRWLCACCVMLVLVPAAVADKYDDLGMINVVATDENNLTWELLDSIYYTTQTKLTREVRRLMDSGRYIESVAPVVGQGALIVHRPNTQNVKQTFSIATSSHSFLQKDIKKKFKDGFSVKYLCVGSRSDAYIVYDRNPQVTKQAFPDKHFEKYSAEGYYLRPLFTYDYTFAQNGQPGGSVEQMDKGYYSTQGSTAERLMKDIEKYKDEGWLLSSVTMYNDSYRAFFDKNPLADRQTTLVFSSIGEVKDFIASGITTNLKVTTQWLTTTSLGRQQGRTQGRTAKQRQWMGRRTGLLRKGHSLGGADGEPDQRRGRFVHNDGRQHGHAFRHDIVNYAKNENCDRAEGQDSS